jgi:predicted nucleic acid-binding protein
MRINQYIAVLDSCVLVPMPVVDTLLRLAEEPAFYSPRWSEHILSEVERVLLDKWKYPKDSVERRIQVMRDSFPEAMVTGYEELIDPMKNDEKDRHVLAAAVRCGAHAIVSNNKKHFPAKLLEPFELECITADEFLEHQYHLNPDLFISKLSEQASDINWTLHQLISKHVPSLARLITPPTP